MGMQASCFFTSSVRPPEPLFSDSDTYWCQAWPKTDWHLQTHFSDLGRGGLTKALPIHNSSPPPSFQLCQHIPSTLTPTRLLEGANGTSHAVTLPRVMGRTRQGQRTMRAAEVVPIPKSKAPSSPMYPPGGYLKKCYNNYLTLKGICCLCWHTWDWWPL